MIVVEKNEGKKIPYTVDGTKICFDDDLTINLAKREQDFDVHIDVCYDGDQELCIGAAAGRSYVAEIDIPERKYTEPEPMPADELAEQDAGEETVEETSEPTMHDSTPIEPIPLDMDKVTLTLWAI